MPNTARDALYFANPEAYSSVGGSDRKWITKSVRVTYTARVSSWESERPLGRDHLSPDTGEMKS